jgi:hypothetical protein
MKTRIRFAKGPPSNYVTYIFFDVVVDKFVIYPHIEIKGKLYHVIEVASVLLDSEVDQMVTVTEDFYPNNPSELAAIP